MTDEFFQRQALQVGGHQAHRRQVRGGGLASDADHRDVLRADVGVRIDGDRSHVHEGPGLDDDAPHSGPSGGPRRKSRGTPLHDSTISGPRPPVFSRTRAIRSADVRFVARRASLSAPNASAARQAGREPIRRDAACPAPSSLALMRWQRPSGPAPSTATEPPKQVAPAHANDRKRASPRRGLRP